MNVSYVMPYDVIEIMPHVVRFKELLSVYVVAFSIRQITKLSILVLVLFIFTTGNAKPFKAWFSRKKNAG